MAKTKGKKTAPAPMPTDAPATIASLLDTPAPFRAWVEVYGEEDTLGHRYSSTQDPFARFLRERGIENVRVYWAGVYYGDADKPVLYRWPEWAGAVVRAMDEDKRAGSEVRKGHLLPVLDRWTLGG